MSDQKQAYEAGYKAGHQANEDNRVRLERNDKYGSYPGGGDEPDRIDKSWAEWLKQHRGEMA